MISPSPAKADYEPAFYEAIGRFVVAFAVAEVGIDAACAITFNGYGGKTLRPRLPINVTSKLQYLREASDQLEKLKPFAKELLFVVDLLEDLGEKRNFIIHGVHGVNDSDEPVFGKPVVTKDNMYMSHHPATTETILSYKEAALFAGTTTIGIVLRLSDHLKSSPGE